MLILITRPAAQNETLRKMLTAHGYACESFPMLEIVSCLDEKKLAEIANAISSCDKIIFTSANAVVPLASEMLGLEVFAIGPGTANALAAYKIHAKIPEIFNSEGLLALPELQHVKGERIIIFSGEGGRDLLLISLTQRGAHVKKIPVYKRICPTLDIKPHFLKWQHQGLDLIISTSSESLPRIAKGALKRLKIKILPSSMEMEYNRGRSRQVPTGRVIAVKERISRKIGYGGVYVSFEKRPK